MCCLDPYRCLRSPEPAAPSTLLISVSIRFGFLLLKNKLWLGFFLVQNPRILCCPCTQPGVHGLYFTPAVLPLPCRGVASCGQTRVCWCSSGYFRSSPQVFSTAIPVSSDQQMPGGELCLMNGQFSPYELPLHKPGCLDLKSGLFQDLVQAPF